MIGMFVPGVYDPNLSSFTSAMYGICLLVNPQNCNKTLPLVLAPYPSIFFPSSTSVSINSVKLFLWRNTFSLKFWYGFGVLNSILSSCLSIQSIIGVLDLYTASFLQTVMAKLPPLIAFI